MAGPSPVDPLRLGILGAARITSLSVVEPARATGHRLVAVAARDADRAESFAAEHGIERVLSSYADVLADPDVEAVYNPLPNAFHAEWNIRAAEAGKHVLAEKPSALDAAEARRVRDAVHASGVVFMEAFHYPYHPLVQRVCGLLEAGAVGAVQRVEAVLRMPAPPDDDPRWSRELGGGATMDLGCYALSCVRLLGRFAGGEPRVVAARADERPGRPGVDERLFADLSFPSGATGLAGSDMASADRDMSLTVRGTAGELVVPMFPVPHEGDTLVLRHDGEVEVVEHLGTRTSYTYQLEAFASAVRERTSVLTDADWSVGNAEIIDAAYEASGLRAGAAVRG
ncbi:Gfo/Idh/MocA family oxidoreductase [Intrasporangium sp. YIM S08009]|uniref:Gfo/Idh/MocA family protein n=1 Tax=Intrasporangium zincisolvens TaxID=3080018 RepID=UPI002B059F8B|nr:Gfo/Idh/MocA family oxidoreductase [Intrasporangium sp. YIM S08009]